MDKSLVNRLEKLEQRIDIGDIRTASTEALLALLLDQIGREPTLAELKKIAAGEPIEEGPKE